MGWDNCCRYEVVHRWFMLPMREQTPTENLPGILLTGGYTIKDATHFCERVPLTLKIKDGTFQQPCNSHKQMLPVLTKKYFSFCFA